MNLTGTGIVLRFLFALLLVLLTYNPSGYSYVHWLLTQSHITPYIVIAGLLLLIGWGVYIKATLNSLGLVGIIVLAALFGSLIWLFIYWGWLSLTDISAMAWAVEVLLAALLAVGMCWSHFTRRMSGQVDVDEIEEK
ncbi:DUF6524 family protein [Cellvibrio japonicus]|uniref:Uncharacterized protein n=1 Tax=Cellvibrio japonicus (strain Ueda107) TaxID=498211 RepID=B3PCR0_CELJU|nr:DUF6524 family protein [Cellvibrio japonicus]ACE84362.1 hypothetical protein CJA_2970 [Cellvibrio japonicus Ueda107]QEI13280.1 hypothetical protein FY117_14320 [Cellvibrio japonicus]QEI16854.1 hypothetical protein FY116_14325 [Cellvibrio japonicus]QEI20432.1 hypothetical protein FY115_14320 [Cellvibrio japonicus]